MSHHHHHKHDGNNQSSSYGYVAPTYNYGPLQQARPAAPYGQQMVPAYGQQGPYYGTQAYATQVMPHQHPSGYGVHPGQELQYLQAEEHRHRQNEHRAEIGALGALAFAAYEKHEEKVDPAHAHRHHVEAQVAEAAALGQGGYALHGHHEANQMYKQEPDVGGVHRHGHHHHH